MKALTIEEYLSDGCGRCDLHATPKCKVNNWRAELMELRQLVLTCGLKEEMKWGQPCYTYNGANVLIVTAFRNYSCISFFKGSLLSDPKGMLITPGKSSQAARQLRFTEVKQIHDLRSIIKAYIHQAVEVEKAGLKVEFNKRPEPWPKELKATFKKAPDLQTAFEALTPGRQRGYVIHFSQPRKSETRFSRIEKCIPRIMAGKGLHDR